jgi:hypothetical protein
MWFKACRLAGVRRAVSALAVTTAVLIGGCASVFDVRPQPYSQSHTAAERIDGLRAMLQRSPERPVRMVYVHGMSTREAGYSADFQRAVAERLELLPDAAQGATAPIVRGYRSELVIYGQPLGSVEARGDDLLSQVRKTVWTDRSGNARLVSYEILWAPARDAMKLRFVECFESRTARSQNSHRCSQFRGNSGRPNTSRRAYLNGRVDDQVMVNGVSDAMLILGDMGAVLQDDFDQAMCMVALDMTADEVVRSPAAGQRFRRNPSGQRPLQHQPGQRCSLAGALDTPASSEARAAIGQVLSEVPVAIVTNSLGSFFVLDAQARNRTQDAGAVGSAGSIAPPQFLLMDRANVYMMANQVALLGLARMRLICFPATSETGEDCPNPRLRRQTGPADGSASDLPGPEPTGTMASLVAFNDADDLLGLELPQWLMETGLFRRVVNVSVSNPGFRIPGLLTGPISAHTAQDENQRIINALVDGIEVPSSSARGP